MQAKVEVGCQQVGEFVDEAELPPGLMFSIGEPVPTRVVAEFVDVGPGGAPTEEPIPAPPRH